MTLKRGLTRLGQALEAIGGHDLGERIFVAVPP